MIKRGLKPKDFISSDDYIIWHRELGVGFYLQGYFPYIQIYQNCDVKEWDDGFRHYKEVVTPVGSVRECWEYIPTSFSDGPVEHFIKSEADFPVMKYIYENVRFEPGDLKFEGIAAIANDSKSISWGGIPGSYFTDCVSDLEYINIK